MEEITEAVVMLIDLLLLVGLFVWAEKRAKRKEREGREK